MKKLFTAIHKNDFDTVRDILEKKPELLFCTAKQPPKKDDGQSPLQIALKTGSFEIAAYMLELGADANFMEAENCCNEWRAPAIHDAINAAVMCSRWNVNSDIYGGIRVFSTKEKADAAYDILVKIFACGGDANAEDSYGNSCLWRLCLQARQILPSYNHSEHKLGTDRIVTPELREDLSRIFMLLFEKGADIDYVKPDLQKTVREQFRDEPLEEFLALCSEK